MVKLLTLILAVLLALPITADAVLPTEVNERSLAMTLNQNSESLSAGAVLGVPIPGINGYAAVLGQRAYLSGVRISQVIVGHLEGGATYKDFDFRLFTDGMKDDNRGTQQIDFGYYVELPEYDTSGFSIAASVGNLNRSGGAIGGEYSDAEFASIKALHADGTLSDNAVARMGLYDELVLGKSFSPVVSTGLKWYLNAQVTHRSGITTDISFIPDATAFSNYDLKFVPTCSWELGSKVRVTAGLEVLLQGNEAYTEPQVFTKSFMSASLEF